jgi:protein SCO1/2
MSLASVGIAIVVGVLTLCPLTWAVGQTPATPAARADDIRSLALRDQHGESTTLRAFEGRTLVLNFIFTHCLVACHTQVKNLNAVRAALPPDIRSRVQFLSISIDPTRDTRETLRQYAQTMGIDDPDWRFATASPDHIARITRAFGVKRESPSDGQIDHTLVVILFDAKGGLMQRYAGAEVNAARLVREIGDVVRLFDPSYQPVSGIGQGR